MGKLHEQWPKECGIQSFEGGGDESHKESGERWYLATGIGNTLPVSVCPYSTLPVSALAVSTCPALHLL